MDLLIIHYHLHPGGVTRIIESQAEGLNQHNLNISILCGNSNGILNIRGIPVFENKLFDYSNVFEMKEKLIEVYNSILATLRSFLTKTSVLHCHNINLGKNALLTIAIYKLASEGIPVINHYHDFPEERIANMDQLNFAVSSLCKCSLNEILYPKFHFYQYIVINSNDYKRILTENIKSENIYLLHNPVSINFKPENQKKSLRNELFSKLRLNCGKKLCLYPVRAIRRKNIGEFILLTALYSEVAYFAITLAPKNPVELISYNRWKEFCSEYNINLIFEIGELVKYEDLILISDFCITTSIQEGFGMIYLEPWLANTPVIGRQLDYIINDLKIKGVQFPRLYNSINVITSDGIKDFKDLDNRQMELIIKAALLDPSKKKEIIKINPFLETMLNDIPLNIISDNKKAINKNFSVKNYGAELLSIYRKVSE